MTLFKDEFRISELFIQIFRIIGADSQIFKMQFEEKLEKWARLMRNLFVESKFFFIID